jgi:hypothetical protein
VLLQNGVLVRPTRLWKKSEWPSRKRVFLKKGSRFFRNWVIRKGRLGFFYRFNASAQRRPPKTRALPQTLWPSDDRGIEAARWSAKSGCRANKENVVDDMSERTYNVIS